MMAGDWDVLYNLDGGRGTFCSQLVGRVVYLRSYYESKAR